MSRFGLRTALFLWCRLTVWTWPATLCRWFLRVWTPGLQCLWEASVLKCTSNVGVASMLAVNWNSKPINLTLEFTTLKCLFGWNRVPRTLCKWKIYWLFSEQKTEIVRNFKRYHSFVSSVASLLFLKTNKFFYIYIMHDVYTIYIDIYIYIF